jgi:cell division protein FtsL
MNAATRISSQAAYAGHRITAAVWNWQTVLISSLLLMVFVSAFAVIYVRDYQRQLITHLQGIQMQHDSMLTQRSQLLLERAAWSTQARVQQVAEQKLGMDFPEQQSIATVAE